MLVIMNNINLIHLCLLKQAPQQKANNPLLRHVTSTIDYHNVNASDNEQYQFDSTLPTKTSPTTECQQPSSMICKPQRRLS